MKKIQHPFCVFYLFSKSSKLWVRAWEKGKTFRKTKWKNNDMKVYQISKRRFKKLREPSDKIISKNSLQNTSKNCWKLKRKISWKQPEKNNAPIRESQFEGLDLSSETMENRKKKEGGTFLEYWWKNFKPTILYQVKYSSRMKMKFRCSHMKEN